MDPYEIENRFEHFDELTPEAKEAARRLLLTPTRAKEEVESFGGLGSDGLDTLHSFAFEFYQNAKYAEAASFFTVLTSLDMLCYDYWMGLGASQMMNGEFQEALTAYGIASTLKQDDPMPHFHAAECYQAQGLTSDALRALEMAEDFCGDKGKDIPLKERIAVFRERWKGEVR